MKPVAETPTTPSDYAAISATYATLLAALLVAARRRGAAPEAPSATELAATGAATFALAKLLAKEKVESWVRTPFVDEAETGSRRPRGDGLRYAVGELLTCTRCVGAWSALGLVGLRTLAPDTGRVVTNVLAASAMNDYLQSGFTWICARSNAAAR
jgi:hypothetical protein